MSKKMRIIHAITFATLGQVVAILVVVISNYKNLDVVLNNSPLGTFLATIWCPFFLIAAYHLIKSGILPKFVRRIIWFCIIVAGLTLSAFWIEALFYS